MGWSWALHFCQKVVEGAVVQANPTCPHVLDKSASIVLGEERPKSTLPIVCSHTACAEYVDNYAALSVRKKDARRKVVNSLSVLHKAGLRSHPIEGG